MFGYGIYEFLLKGKFGEVGIDEVMWGFVCVYGVGL